MEERLTKLEVKLAYAEETIVTLDSVVTEQAKEIALLQSRLEKLEKRVTDMVEESGDGLLGEQRPPHY
ncbi:MAG: SlyX family protein [Sphaerochaeta sp.]|jgi:SlyX protein|uniref:Protein SlyX n=1 Tax=bioreactor metagenome TaxID=1076179 RepID=A0A645G905_9ZZZZ|nr:SlyX family protein [uncultured Sphaerochaeta sp.]MDD3057563.1 SlyX family protein [Sphaerochaeta sp.]NCC14172.1 SlyX family protein [Spirochaetia bacterium]MDD3928777.1 SlyX family protein [Sphaerochaeta sp.]MEA4860515.1 SlyX family protein [Sphaerochaeta sp.]NCC88775.1 SlyX family protein [Spirochaetia bacterium]